MSVIVFELLDNHNFERKFKFVLDAWWCEHQLYIKTLELDSLNLGLLT